MISHDVNSPWHSSPDRWAVVVILIDEQGNRITVGDLDLLDTEKQALALQPSTDTLRRYVTENGTTDVQQVLKESNCRLETQIIQRKGAGYPASACMM